MTEAVVTVIMFCPNFESNLKKLSSSKYDAICCIYPGCSDLLQISEREEFALVVQGGIQLTLLLNFSEC